MAATDATNSPPDATPPGTTPGQGGDPDQGQTDPNPTKAAADTPDQTPSDQTPSGDSGDPGSSGASTDPFLEMSQEQLATVTQGQATQTYPNLPAQSVGTVDLSTTLALGAAPQTLNAGAQAMIEQAHGLTAEASAAYFDGISKVILASQSVMARQMTQNVVAEDYKDAANDALMIAISNILLHSSLTVAAAGGATATPVAGLDSLTAAANEVNTIKGNLS